MPFVTIWVDHDGIMLSEMNQTAKDKFCMRSFICGIQKKKKKNLIDTENRLMVDSG